MICKTSFFFTVARIAGILIVLLMIVSGCSKKNDTSPAQLNTLFGVILGTEENVIPPSSPGLLYSPDEHLSYLANTGGSFSIWFAADGGTVGFSSPDLSHLTPIKSDNGAPSPLLAPSGPGTTAFDQIMPVREACSKRQTDRIY